jgi:phage baseplate assembly protein W
MSFAMSLTDENTAAGRLLNLVADINQAIEVILTTPKNSKIHDPDFGCALFEHLDQPMTRTVKIIAAVAQALRQYEQRIRVKTITPDFSAASSGQLMVVIEYKILSTGQIQRHTTTLSSP